MLSRTGALLMILFTACAASPAKPRTPWRVELATSGGFAGRGVGTISIDSDANLSVKTPTGKTCTTHASEAEMARVEKLLAESHPEKWGSYVPENKCCDRIEYTLTYDEHTAEWIDDPLPLPDDVAKLSAALAEIRRAHECK